MPKWGTMTVKSEFQSDIWFKYSFGLLLLMAVLSISLYNSFIGGEIQYNGAPFLIFTLTLLVSLAALVDIFQVSKISVTTDAILNETIILKKITHLAYSEFRQSNFQSIEAIQTQEP